MKRPAELPPWQGGRSALMEVYEVAAGPAVHRLGKSPLTVAKRADEALREPAPTVTSPLLGLIDRLRSSDNLADDVGMEFGVRLGGQTGAFIASVAAEANFSVSMTCSAAAVLPVGERSLYE